MSLQWTKLYLIFLIKFLNVYESKVGWGKPLHTSAPQRPKTSFILSKIPLCFTTPSPLSPNFKQMCEVLSMNLQLKTQGVIIISRQPTVKCSRVYLYLATSCLNRIEYVSSFLLPNPECWIAVSAAVKSIQRKSTDSPRIVYNQTAPAINKNCPSPMQGSWTKIRCPTVYQRNSCRNEDPVCNIYFL